MGIGSTMRCRRNYSFGILRIVVKIRSSGVFFMGRRGEARLAPGLAGRGAGGDVRG